MIVTSFYQPEESTDPEALDSEIGILAIIDVSRSQNTY